MFCNNEIHNNVEQIICPFCDEQINDYVPKIETCCKQENLFTTWARFPLFSQGIKFNIPRSLSTI